MRELMSGAEDVLGREARRRAVFSPEFYTLGSYLRMSGRAGEGVLMEDTHGDEIHTDQSVDPELWQTFYKYYWRMRNGRCSLIVSCGQHRVLRSGRSSGGD